MNLQIIHEDNDIILCRKPAGVATQTKKLGQQDMESLLKNYRAKKGEPSYIGVVHRLDQPVEGLMVFAKNQRAAASLSKQIQQHMIGKHYYAISEHAPAEQEGLLEDYLVTDKKMNVTIVVEMHDELAKSLKNGSAKSHLSNDAKKAVLEYKVLAQKEGKTLFDITLHTGRQHQIRVQMAHMGCPLVGDSKYGQTAGCGAGDGERSKALNWGREPLALCSYRLQFAHPTTGKPMDFSIVPQGKFFSELDILKMASLKRRKEI